MKSVFLKTTFETKDSRSMDLFNKALIIMRIADLTILNSTREDEKPVVTIVDETSCENGWAPVRKTADPCLVAKGIRI